MADDWKKAIRQARQFGGSPLRTVLDFSFPAKTKKDRKTILAGDVPDKVAICANVLKRMGLRTEYEWIMSSVAPVMIVRVWLHIT